MVVYHVYSLGSISRKDGRKEGRKKERQKERKTEEKNVPSLVTSDFIFHTIVF
jgi:hypothetical protein